MTLLRTANMLGALAGAITDRLEALLHRHPRETGASWAALNLIGSYSGCSNRDLSQALKLSHSATVRLVDKLEQNGLVVSAPGQDRREVALSLTDAGRAEIGVFLRERCLALETMITALSPAQRAALVDITETMLRTLTTTQLEAAHICRLCGDFACPEDLCPVHETAMRLEIADAQLNSREAATQP